ncbi:alkaline-phosphatase-like protein, partial [Pelagophyceae sp. CCMP2097]
MRLAVMALLLRVCASLPDVVFIVQVQTPHLNALARDALDLLHYHTLPVCSPSRATMLSGFHAIHHGIYTPFEQGSSTHLALEYKLLPQFLKQAGFKTHAIGKWHLGQNSLEALPTHRGFDSYSGYWCGAEDHYTHTTKGAYDFARGDATDLEANGTYADLLFTARTVEIVKDAARARDPAAPLEEEAPFFVWLAFQNVHWPLQAPEGCVAPYRGAPTAGDEPRALVCGMVSFLDAAVGNVTGALKESGLYDGSIIIFVSDNGGPTNMDEGTASNNFPMRGGKNTLWEGGTRVVGLVKAPGLVAGKSLLKFHATGTDWLYTLIHAATGRVLPQLPGWQLGDGMDLWPALLGDHSAERTELLLETHDVSGVLHGDGLIFGDWKILRLGETHPSVEAGWQAPPGEDANSTNYVLGCDVSRQPSDANVTEQCVDAFCLFNITADPCEYDDLASKLAKVLQQLESRLEAYRATAVAAVAPSGCDPIR